MKKKETNKAVDEVENISPEEAKERRIDQTVTQELERLLKGNNRGLQPFLLISEFGIVPRVRLARTNEENQS